jgi:hypothetical protein
MNTHQTSVVRIADDETLAFHDLAVPFTSPTGAQILAAANAPQEETVLLQRLLSGDLESINLAETPNLDAGKEFVLSASDRTYSLFVNDSQLAWAVRHISGATLRKLAKVPDSFDLFQLKKDGEAHQLQADTLVDLNLPGVEKFVTRLKTWKLKVQAVTLEYDVQYVKVGQAMTRAGYDPAKAWDIYLLVAGQPKQKVDVNFVVDLATLGIERIRLMQRNIDNGEASALKARREFSLLNVDVEHLGAIGFSWETIRCGENRWLVIHDYPLPQGYQPSAARLALLIHKDYPQAQIDMFYFDPPVSRSDGVAIPNTQVTATIGDVVFQGWSRHRNGTQPWDPLTDNVATHLTLVEHSLAREFGE